MQARIGVVIVSFNDPDLTLRTLASLCSGSHVPEVIVVVDNSTSNFVQNALADDDRVVYHRTEENLGFCGANNLGIHIALDRFVEFVLLLNHDTLMDPNCFERLAQRAFLEKGQAIVTPKVRLLPDRERLWYAGGFFSRLIGAGKNIGFGSLDQGQFDTAGNVTYATGCCMLIPVSVFKSAGYLNSHMFMYLDDIEFCLRARKNGFSIYYEPGAILYHELGSGARFRQRPDYYLYFSIRNKPLVVSPGAYRLYLYLVAVVFGCIKIIQVCLYPGIEYRWRKTKALFWGMIDAFSSEEKFRGRFPRLFRHPN